ncbi:helix-turn-helix domain-containing protein [Salinicoccus roseus]|uniref:helix-turn-helix domain-containing protein n=1 Tax=Salinicoccus roseus TaxID=45670 RepID=UPI003DA11340
MAIRINIDVMLTKRKMSVTELSNRVGITMVNLSILNNGKARAIRSPHLKHCAGLSNASPGIYWSMWMMMGWRNRQ